MIRVVLHPWYPTAVDTALRALPGLDVLLAADQDEVAAALADGAQVLVTSYWRADFLTPSLRWIAGTGAGFEQYPLGDLAARGIPLTTAHGVHSACVAEHAFALLLACTRGIGRSVRNMTRHRWAPLTGEELGGKRMLVVGLGLIGEEIARRALAWDMTVAGIKRDPSSYRGVLGDVRDPGALPDLCEWADIVVLAAPSTAETRGLIGARELALLGPGWLVNVARGALVDTEALCAALRDGELRGAGLDVTDPEPLPADSPLWDAENVVISAHGAGDSPGYGPRWGRLFERNLRAFTGEGPWHNRVGER
ncbi:MAG TPA: D-2-hydroxyacid dehydrogenase [Amycolatopsis sp.]|nr:D-2-hydroxyacid dehydrogenase [Amycolatopsis sp.]